MQRRYWNAIACATVRHSPTALTLAIALALSQAAPAQSAEDELLGEVTVTGSRVERSGFAAPTPTSVVSAEDMQRSAPIAIAEALAQIPSFRIASSPVTANTFADLRRVGAQRTLVLVDGRRHVPSQSNGTVDLNVVPAAMVERTELVTGGASASWGSDAVSGVVNIVLRKNLEGFIGNIQGGISKYGDDESVSGSFAFGHKIGERTHLLVGAEYANSEGVGSSHPPELARPWGINGNVGNTSTTNGLPGTIYAHDVRRSTLSPGGLIISVPLTATNPNLVALRGLQFLPNGQTAPFGFGQVFGNRMIGGTDNAGEYTNVGGATKYPLERYTVLTHIDHELTDDTRVFFEGSYAHSLTDGRGNPARNEGTTPFGATPTCTQDAAAPAGGRFRTLSTTALGTITVGIDNPYLPAAVRTLMQGGGINCFSMGRSWREPGLGEFQAHDGVPKMLRGALGGSGKLAGTWSWDAYFQSGRTEYNTIRSFNRNEAKFRNAMDAVDEGLLRTGVRNNNIVCRINADTSTTNNDAACVPVNMFGFGSISEAAKAYFVGTSRLEQWTWQSVGAATLRGEPFSVWAGPVSIATGLEYRQERIKAVADPIAEANGWHTGNVKSIQGSYEAREYFAEAVIPLAKDKPLARELDLTLAGRHTDYTSSGGVTTWKAGLSHTLNDQLRLRATRSRDIRAGNLGELFTATSVTVGNIRNPLTNVTSQVPVTTRGNPSLEPENANTTTAGIVYAPSWLEGLRLSADWYSIRIKGLIGVIQSQQVLDRCYLDNLAQFCADVATGTGGVITGVTVRQQNLNYFETSGVDIEAAYRFPLSSVSENLPGRVNVRLLANYVDKLATTAAINATTTELAGQYTNPEWTLFGTVGYDLGRFSAVLDLRYFGSGTIDNAKTVGTGPLNLNVNDVASNFLTNATFQYDLGDKGPLHDAQIYLRVNNVFNRGIPFPSQGVGGAAAEEFLVGREFRLGARFRF
ncbi:MAG: TonB-dependent receptor [Steroidobacteraceae bacterium]